MQPTRPISIRNSVIKKSANTLNKVQSKEERIKKLRKNWNELFDWMLKNPSFANGAFDYIEAILALNCDNDAYRADCLHQLGEIAFKSHKFLCELVLWKKTPSYYRSNGATNLHAMAIKGADTLQKLPESDKREIGAYKTEWPYVISYYQTNEDIAVTARDILRNTQLGHKLPYQIGSRSRPYSLTEQIAITQIIMAASAMRVVPNYLYRPDYEIVPNPYDRIRNTDHKLCQKEWPFWNKIFSEALDIQFKPKNGKWPELETLEYLCFIGSQNREHYKARDAWKAYVAKKQRIKRTIGKTWSDIKGEILMKIKSHLRPA